MPVFIGDDVVQHNHPVKGVRDTGHAQRLTAVDVVPVDRSAVVFLLRLHDTPRTDQLRVRRDEVFTDTVGDSLIPNKAYVGNIQSGGNAAGNHFIKGLLHKGLTACL